MNDLFKKDIVPKLSLAEVVDDSQNDSLEDDKSGSLNNP